MSLFFFFDVSQLLSLRLEAVNLKGNVEYWCIAVSVRGGWEGGREEGRGEGGDEWDERARQTQTEGGREQENRCASFTQAGKGRKVTMLHSWLLRPASGSFTAGQYLHPLTRMLLVITHIDNMTWSVIYIYSPHSSVSVSRSTTYSTGLMRAWWGISPVGPGT